MPQGCIIFQNENGTAPGCAIKGSGELEGKTAIMLRVRREMKPMFERRVKPYLLKDGWTPGWSPTPCTFLGLESRCWRIDCAA